MPINYKTVQKFGQDEYEISRSRFIAFVYRVTSVAEALGYIQQIKKEHWEARHNCSAYVIGEQASWQKADDDGEPSGTAGKPILEIIKKQGLTDTLIIVTRYFGGIKLGAGGLIRAYGKAASLGLAAAGIVEKVLYRRLHITIDYALLGTLENNLHAQSYQIEAKDFADKVCLTVLAKTDAAESVEAEIINWTSANCTIEKGEEIYLEIPMKES